MHRPVVVAMLAAALLYPGCVSHREKRASEVQRKGDHERALRMWESLAKRGEPMAQYRVGLMLAIGQGAVADENEAVHWFREAARQGIVAAQAKLGHLYLDGRGHPEEDPDAERWLQGVAEKGSADIKYRIAVLYLEGGLVERNTEEALRLFRTAAATWPAIVTRLYKEGLLRTVAELGLDEAQYGLGNLYYQGTGVPKSPREAAKWYYLAANQGHAKAQLALGWTYGGARGVPKDLKESARWFRKAAEQGQIEAQYQLGMLYSRGLGVPKDHVQAHMWFNLAASQGHQAARGKREAEYDLMTVDQRAKAEELAVEWSIAAEAEPEAEQ
jgi:TPR repeat protein